MIRYFIPVGAPPAYIQAIMWTLTDDGLACHIKKYGLWETGKSLHNPFTLGKQVAEGRVLELSENPYPEVSV